MAKILKMTKSLNDLNKLLDMETIPVNQVVIEAPQNFYSFLHKRNRFYENDVIKTDCKLNTNTNELRTTITSVHNKFEIKKINIDESIIKRKEGRNGEFKEDVAYIEIFKNFKWQKDEFYSKLVTRHIQNAKTLTNNQLACDTNLQLQPDWRLTIGLGGGSVFETSITLHHVYGFPYIPASAVKGVLRSYLITELQGYEANREALLFRNNKEMCDIFGCGEETLY